MSKVKVLHQVLDPSGTGGVSAEYRALKNSKLTEIYDFEPMVLNNFYAGLNLHDIMFYYKYIKKVNPDIIHVRGAAIDGLNAIIAAKLTHKGKILVTVHGMYSDLVYISPLKKWICKNIIERLSFQLADGISCVCRHAAEREYFKPYGKKMLPFVYNRMPHFDLNMKEQYRDEIRRQYNILKDDIVGIYVGRMTREKGLETLLESLNRLKQDWPEKFTVLFVGDGDFRTKMEQACVQISNRIRFAGNQSDVEKYYAAGDFFLQPSLHENHSISLLEACAAGLPCIATDCGGNAEIVEEGITGIVIPIRDEKALSAAIYTMCQDETRNWYAKNIYKSDYSRFSDEAVDDVLGEVYKKLMEK
ncbi:MULTISPECIES: glycosyltransferase [Blautia]|uniref:glycosyltransferase n=1 Tax=Blautia TaxID=572511 RepID=UPI000BA3FF88|nr:MULTISPECIES: glycosyltransferase [Blautia]